TDNLTFIHRLAGFDEEFTAVLQVMKAIGNRFSLFHGDQRAVDPAGYFAFIRLIFDKPVCCDGFTGRNVEQVISKADNAPRRNEKLQYHPVALRLHVDHLAFADGDGLDRFAGVALREVDGELFHGFAFHPVDFLKDHLRLPDLQFVSFTPHSFDQYRQVQYTPTEDHKAVG